MVLEGRLVRTSSAENALRTSSGPCICLWAFLCGAFSGIGASGRVFSQQMCTYAAFGDRPVHLTAWCH